jgi:hypothetical protein
MPQPPNCLQHKDIQSSFTKSDEEPTSLTLVGNSADSPEPILSPSSATGHDAEILEV